MSEKFYLENSLNFKIDELDMNDIQLLAFFATTLKDSEEKAFNSVLDKYVMLKVYCETKMSNHQKFYELLIQEKMSLLSNYFYNHPNHYLYDTYKKIIGDFLGRRILPLLIQLCLIEQHFKTEEVTTEDINYYLKIIDEYKKIMRLNEQEYNAMCEQAEKIKTKKK